MSAAVYRLKRPDIAQLAEIGANVFIAGIIFLVLELQQNNELRRGLLLL